MSRAERRREKKEMEKQMKRFFKENEERDFFNDFLFMEPAKTESMSVFRG